MYKDLSLKEKAKVIREGVKLGLNSIDDILNLYDEAISYLQGGPIVSPYGQWKYPGRDTIIPSNNITMANINYPVLGVSDTGDTKIMIPWNDYKFEGSMVYEHPLQEGGNTKPTFDLWYPTVPKQKNDTSSYDLRRAYNMLPFDELEKFRTINDYHLPSVAYDEKTDTYTFLKRNGHPTLNYELDWYNSGRPDALEFRERYKLDTLNLPWRYVPITYLNGGGLYLERIKPIEEFITPLEPMVLDNTYVVRNYPYYLLPEIQNKKKRLSDEEISNYYGSNIVWTMENPKHKGLNPDGTYSAYEDEAGFNFGPGLHAKSNNLDINKTYTKLELDSIASNIALNYMKLISEDLETMLDGKYAGARDTLSAGPLLTMLDIAYNVKPKNKGNMPQKWPNLTDSLINGNIEKAKENTYSGSTRRQKMRNQMIVYKPLEGITVHNEALGGNLFKKGGHLYQSKGFIDFKSPEDILAEKYGTEPVVADNTNIVLNPVYTPQEKSYTTALLAFYERHKSPEAEEKALREARLAVKALQYTELSRRGQINNADLDTRTWWSKNWPQAKNWIDSHFSLVGDLKDTTNGIVDLKYFIPGIGLATLFGDMVKNVDDGRPANALVDAAFVLVPYYNQLKSAGTNIANQWVMPRGMAGSYELRFQNILKPSYWREVINPNSYNEAVEQVKHFHDAYRAPRIAGNDGWIINKDIVERFRDPSELNFQQNINPIKIKTDRKGNIKSIKVNKPLLFEKGDIKNPQIIPSNPFNYIWNNGIKGYFNSTGVNHGGTKFYLNYAHPKLIGVDPKVLKGIAAHEMQHSALKLIKQPYLELSMPRDGYYGPNIFFLLFHPNINFDVMDAKEPNPDFIDKLIRFKDNTATFLRANPFELRKLKFDHSPIKSRKSNQWYRSPDELDAEMANFRYLYDINVPLKDMPVDLLNKAIDIMSRRFKVSSRDDMGNFMMQLSNIGHFSKGGSIHIKPENRGKFTALKKRTGHSASWFKAHGTPALRKMATFALNSKHWNHKHDEGGYLYSEGGFLLAPYLYNE